MNSILIKLFYAIFFLSFLSCVPVEEYSLGSEAPEAPRFSIRFNTDFYEDKNVIVPLYELSSDDEVSLRDCGIEKGSESVEHLYCILDLNEADIGVLGQAGEGIQLQYNVPSEMCEYTVFQHPWHWNQRSGFGPQVVDECTVTEATNTLQVNVGGQNSGSSSSSSNDNTYIRVAGGGWEKQTKEGTGCEYDQSDGDSILKNCCFGKVRKIKYKSTTGHANNCEREGGDAPDPEDWGGDAQECIGGPARISDKTAWLNIESVGSLPTQSVSSTWRSGVRETITLGPVSGEGEVQFTTVPTANYFNGVEDLLFTDYILGNVDQSVPEMFFPDYSVATRELRDQSENPVSLIGYPYFTLSCLDSNFEILHAVHLIIREWNTLDEFLSFKETDGRSGDPDISGEEGSGDCQYYEADEKLTSTECNDFSDLDDHTPGTLPAGVSEILELFRTTCNGYPCIDYDGGGSSSGS